MNKINEIIERSNIYANDFKIAYHGIVEKHHYLETFDEVGLVRHRLIRPAVYNLLKNGATLIVNKIVNEPDIDLFARQVAQLTGRQTVYEFVCRFLGIRTLIRHIGTLVMYSPFKLKDVSVGSFMNQPFPNPICIQQSKYFEDTYPCPDIPYMDVILEEGDVLYVPCGWWHNPSPLGEETVHLAIGTFPAFGLDYAEWLFKKLPDLHEIRKPMSNWENDCDNLKIIAKYIGDLIINQSTYNEFMQEFIGKKRVESNLALELLGDSKVNKLPMTTKLRLNSDQFYDKK